VVTTLDGMQQRDIMPQKAASADLTFEDEDTQPGIKKPLKKKSKKKSRKALRKRFMKLNKEKEEEITPKHHKPGCHRHRPPRHSQFARRL